MSISTKLSKKVSLRFNFTISHVVISRYSTTAVMLVVVTMLMEIVLHARRPIRVSELCHILSIAFTLFP